DPTPDGRPRVHGGGYAGYRAGRRAERERWEQEYARQQEQRSKLEDDLSAAQNRLVSGWRPDKGTGKHQRATRAGGLVTNVHRRRAALEAHAVTMPEPPQTLRFPDLSARPGATLVSGAGITVDGRLPEPISLRSSGGPGSSSPARTCPPSPLCSASPPPISARRPGGCGARPGLGSRICDRNQLCRSTAGPASSSPPTRMRSSRRASSLPRRPLASRPSGCSARRNSADESESCPWDSADAWIWHWRCPRGRICCSSTSRRTICRSHWSMSSPRRCGPPRRRWWLRLTTVSSCGTSAIGLDWA